MKKMSFYGSLSLNKFVAIINSLLALLLLPTSISAEAVFNAVDACAFNLTDSQEKYYAKTSFVQHARVAEVVGNILEVFYSPPRINGKTGMKGKIGSWSISPEDLQDIVLSNIHAVEGTVIFGSAIAFEPEVWWQSTELATGVPFPAASKVCLDISDKYCERIKNETTQEMVLPVSSTQDYQVRGLARTQGGERIYCPYAYHRSPDNHIYNNCSKENSEYCPSMDIAHAYDYSNTTDLGNEWYTAPRCLFFRDGIRTGYWTSPYFDEGAGMINMVTYSQPFFYGDIFLGVATIDIEVDALCYGSQCDSDHSCPTENYSFNISECTGSVRTITYSSPFPDCPIDPGAISTLDCSYVPVSSSIGILSIILAIFGALICLFVMIFIVVMRKTALMKASQVDISCGFVAGALLGNLSTIALLGERNTIRCKVIPWALILPVTICLAFLFGKVYRAHKLFEAARKFKRVQVTSKELLSKIFLVIVIQIILLLLWTFVEDIESKSVMMTESVDRRYCIGENCHPTEQQCIERFNILGYLSFLYLGLIIIIGCVLSYQSRKLPNCLAEAKFIMLAMYNVAIFSIMVGIVLSVGRDELPASVETLLVTLVIFFISTGSVLLVFGPKFLKVCKLSEHEIKRMLQESISPTTTNT